MAIAPDRREMAEGSWKTDVSLVDADVHNYPKSIDSLTPYMSRRWVEYVRHTGFQTPPVDEYPRFYEAAARRDAWPPNGDRPGSNPDFVTGQL
ncbi:MAG TPA: hypothetical protein QGG37_00775, partial [Chloroflexota bacterium]|nr:hypothetical protein [Chloroflexota bacterium]